MDKMGTVTRILKVVLGILLFIAGIMLLSAPVVSAVFALGIAGIVMMAVGVVQLVCGSSRRRTERIFAANVVVSVMNSALGALIWMMGSSVLAVFLPLFVSIWLAVFGVVRTVEGLALKKQGGSKWKMTIGIGVVSLIGAVLLIVLHWVAAMDIIGILLGAFVIIYGLHVLSDGIVKDRSVSAAERLQEDEEISASQNEAFLRFEEKLHEDDK